MNIINHNIIELVPTAGCWLTQKEEVHLNERVYSQDVYVDSEQEAARWREATQEEKDAYDEMVRTRMEEEFNEINQPSDPIGNL